MFKYTKILLLSLFFIFSIFINANEGEISRFLSIGNLKIVRQEPLSIEREDLTIIINKDKSIKVETDYTFKNIGKYNIKSTYMFFLDKENKAEKGKYIKNIQFYSNHKKAENLRALINFQEKKYENQISDNIEREWFAISKIIKPNEIGKVNVSYNLMNLELEKNKKFTYSFDLVENFNNKNEVKIFYVKILNKSNLDIKNINYKDYIFKEIENSKYKEYELLIENEKLENNLVIEF